LSREAIFYVNARDEGCDERFVWCEKEPRRLVGAEYPWLETQPDDFNGNENCVAFVIVRHGLGLGFLVDMPCFVKNYFICEVNSCFLVRSIY